jgi:YidC/Oxa1 family membrane protein insertase
MVVLAIPGVEQIAKACAYALQWLATLLAGGNYGVAIILLTILMRIVILPLSIKQTKSMIAMQKLQPQLKEIQKKYKDDREKQGQEMMRLYKENKVSPLGGCLPLLLQLPIIFAVFEVLRNLSIGSPYRYIFLADQTRALLRCKLCSCQKN